LLAFLKINRSTSPHGEVASDSRATEGVFSARNDTRHSNAGNVPLDELKKTCQGQGRFLPAAAWLCELPVCKLARDNNVLFRRAVQDSFFPGDSSRALYAQFDLWI
jgi:hypothetical protein